MQIIHSPSGHKLLIIIQTKKEEKAVWCIMGRDDVFFYINRKTLHVSECFYLD